MGVKNILIQKVNDEDWCAFLYQRPQEVLAKAPTLEELVKLLSTPTSKETTAPNNRPLPKVGDLYYRVSLFRDFEFGGDIGIGEERITKDQIDYMEKYGKCPPNVFQSVGQAKAMKQKVIGLFKDYCGKWE